MTDADADADGGSRHANDGMHPSSLSLVRQARDRARPLFFLLKLKLPDLTLHPIPSHILSQPNPTHPIPSHPIPPPQYGHTRGEVVTMIPFRPVVTHAFLGRVTTQKMFNREFRPVGTIVFSPLFFSRTKNLPHGISLQSQNRSVLNQELLLSFLCWVPAKSAGLWLISFCGRLPPFPLQK